ncbi:MAG: tRNA (adenosine(37)-N6)-threonylcarbamoyltransferase complex ATPase subunit type 1 TsaE [Neisseria sp.]|nr:tRNA (adenosine(37)-N6)-threonylcarbamoyltransferase complex ATPase subunit type 1 TsaE [Neisseria sp.]
MNTAPNPSVFLADETATAALGASLAAVLRAPLVVYLDGDLGAGKTTFTRGLLRGLGHEGAVKSPTYAIVESYQPGNFALHHFDLYRFAAPEEWEDAGLDDLTGNSVCLIEWPEKGSGFAPAPDMTLRLSHLSDGRRAEIIAHTANGQEQSAQWISNLPAAK